MSKEKVNILIIGLLKTGSSALVDLLREYDNIGIVPGEFDEFRAPGLVADHLTNIGDDKIPNKIQKLLNHRTKLRLIYNLFPIFNYEMLNVAGFKNQFFAALNQIKRFNLLKRLSNKLISDIELEEKVEYSKNWIKDVGKLYSKNKDFVLYNQPLEIVNDIDNWGKVFSTWKLIVVYRDPRDQLADIIKFGYLFETYGGPYMNLSGVTLESIYGRNREGAIKFHIDALKKRLEWIDLLRKKLDSNKFLLIDFEGFVNNYEHYKSILEKFIGGVDEHHQNNRLYFDPKVAKKSIGIYNDYLTNKELSSLIELDDWYNTMIKSNVHK